MYCSKCGKELPENVKFCNECGNAVGSSVEESNLSGISDNKKNDKTPARSSGNAFSLVLGLIIGIAVTSVVALLLVLLRSVGAESKKSSGTDNFANTSSVQGEGFDTPEDAIRAYAEYLRDGDINGIYSVFAVESYLKHYDMKEAFEYTHAYQPYLQNTNNPILLLDGSDLANGINLESRKSYIKSELYKSYIYCMAQQIDDEEIRAQILSTNPKALEDEDIDDVISFLESNPGFKDMKIKDIMKPSDFGFEREDFMNDSDDSLKKILGVDDIENVSLRISFDGDDYVIFMVAARYGNKWYLVNFNNVVCYRLGVSSLSGGMVLYDSLAVSN